MLTNRIRELASMKEMSESKLLLLRKSHEELHQKRIMAEQATESLASEYCFKQETLVSLTQQLAIAVQEFAMFSNETKQQILNFEEEANHANHWTLGLTEANSRIQVVQKKLKAARAGRQAVVEAEDLMLSDSIESEELALLESQALLSSLQAQSKASSAALQATVL